MDKLDDVSARLPTPYKIVYRAGVTNNVSSVANDRPKTMVAAMPPKTMSNSKGMLPNTVVSAAIEFRSEGRVTGTGAKMFTIAGPVIVYGTLASAVYGAALWAAAFFSS